MSTIELIAGIGELIFHVIDCVYAVGWIILRIFGVKKPDAYMNACYVVGFLFWLIVAAGVIYFAA